MKINAKKLKQAAERAGVGAAELAAALPTNGRRKQAEWAVSKVRNWMAGRDHPRCKPADMAAMARVLGVQPKDIATFQQTFRFARSAPRKARLVTDLVNGKNAVDAENMLAFSPKRAAVMVKRALLAARNEAERNGIAVDRMKVTESRCGESFKLKRFQPKDRGRAFPIWKRASHITISVEEVG